MADLETLKALRERVLKAQGSDNQLDDDICIALGCKPGEWWWQVPWDTQRWAIPPVTYSIDASLALVERCLPGWDWEVESYGGCILTGPEFTDLNPRQIASECASTAPLAILVALLAALIAQQEQGA